MENNKKTKTPKKYTQPKGGKHFTKKLRNPDPEGRTPPFRCVTCVKLRDFLEELIFIESGGPQSWLEKLELLALKRSCSERASPLAHIPILEKLGNRSQGAGEVMHDTPVRADLFQARLAPGHFIQGVKFGVSSAVVVDPMGETTAEDRGKGR